MLMPGRRGHSVPGGWATSGGSENGLPASLEINGRGGNQPAEYRATESIEFTAGFTSGEGDSFETFLTNDAGSGSGSSSGTGEGTGGYRYGFNGKENDDDVKGEGSQQDYGMRIYDPRLGRFLSVDPLTKDYPFYTPFQFAGNMPIRAIDLDGLEITLSDVWHGRANIVDWVNDAGDRALEWTNSNFNPLYQAYQHGYEIVKKKDFYTGEDKPRSLALNSASADAMLWLTGERVLSPLFKVEAAFEKQALKTTAAMGQAEKSAAQKEAQNLTNQEIKSTVVQAEVPGRVQSRVNVANGRTRFTPMRPSTGQPVSAGWDHVVQGHFNRPVQNNRSIFTITEDELKSLLQSKTVVSSPAKAIEGGQFVRTVNTGKVVGTTSIKEGGVQTTWLQVISDKAGNLITTYPVKNR